MNWQVIFDGTAIKQMRKLDKQAHLQISRFVRERLETLHDPRSTGKALKGKLSGLWRYRTGNYRLICKIQDSELVILVVELGDRKDIYE